MSTQYPQVTIPDTEVRRLKSALNSDEYQILRLQTQILVGETHLSVVPYNIGRGLRWVHK